MSEAVQLHFNAPPSVIRAYPRALLDRAPPLLPEGRTVPRITASVGSISAQPEQVNRYSDVCGFGKSGYLPITYPHVLAMSLHMAMLTHDAFDVRLMGLVHVANRIRRCRPLALREVMDVECELEGHQETERGQEFELITRVLVSDEMVWEETSTFLARRRGGRRRSSGVKDPGSEQDRDGAIVNSFDVPASIGRRYAMVSGDFNPIHLSNLSAKLFGFPRAIAHGMWSLARCMAELDATARWDAVAVATEFTLPILLPARVVLRADEGGGGCRLQLSDPEGERPHLIGDIIRL